MSASPPYLEVAVAAPLPQTLTYALPAGGEIPVPGQRVLVPLGGRLLTGYVLAASDEKPEFRLKPIAGLLDDFPVFPENMVPFFRWVARYYHYPIGEVIRGALPGGLTSQSGRQIKVTEAGLHSFLVKQPQLAQEYPWLATLTSKKKLSGATVRKLWRGKEKRLIEQWAEQGLISVEQIISAASIGQKTETCVFSAAEPLAPELLASLKPSEKKTLALLGEMLPHSPRGLPRRELTRVYSGAAKALAALAAKRIIRLEERPVYRDPFGETPLFYPRPDRLTVDQAKVLAQLNPAIAKKNTLPSCCTASPAAARPRSTCKPRKPPWPWAAAYWCWCRKLPWQLNWKRISSPASEKPWPCSTAAWPGGNDSTSGSGWFPARRAS